MMDKFTEVCPECEGDGNIDWSLGDDTPIMTDACEKCKGTGRIPTWPTVSEWEKATGKKLQDDDLIWYTYQVKYKDGTWSKYEKGWGYKKFGKLLLDCNRLNYIVVVPQAGLGMPKPDWRPK